MNIPVILAVNATPAVTEAAVGVQPANANTTIAITTATPAGVITATIVGGSSQVRDKTITLTRTAASGKWNCVTTVK